MDLNKIIEVLGNVNGVQEAVSLYQEKNLTHKEKITSNG